MSIADTQSAALAQRIGRLIAEGARDLPPGYFSLVMATGANSIAAKLLGLGPIAVALLGLNLVAYLAIWSLNLLRLWRHFPRLVGDLTDHARGPGFFTWVAATCVLGSQVFIVAGAAEPARLLWALGIALWVVVMYSFFLAVTTRTRKPSLASGINGAWLIAAVATQSVCVLGALLAPGFGDSRPAVLFLALCMFLLGCGLYLSIITLIFYRLTFVRLTAETMTPPYWINMGAVAITTLAGSTLVLHAGDWQVLLDILPFLKGFTLFFWVTATWWIPLLLLLMVWRHVRMRHSLAYDPQFWGMAFPLGMYATGTYRLLTALDLPFLIVLPWIFLGIGLTVWSLTLIGLLRHLRRNWLALGAPDRAAA
ncbi:MAG: tellurite resistance/C4-dicarboxylate transporter family protein [Pseudomonadota bacterium]